MANKTNVAKEFRLMLAWNHQLATELDAVGFPLEKFQSLQQWQRNRLARSYQDFMARDADAPACRFFLQELYGGMDFRRRDQEVARVAPVMTRMLPERVLRSLAQALHLQGISLQFDMEMACLLSAGASQPIDEDTYGRTYRACGRRADREKQILLIRSLGHDLERLVSMPSLRRLIRAMRRPAIASGFAALQVFLEEGVAAFYQLSDAADFVETIHRRETQSMIRLFAAAEDPFGFRVTG